MTIVRVDAASTLLGQWTRTGGATHHGVISDGSDATYLTAPVTAAGSKSDEWFTLGSWSSPGASYNFKRWRIAYRINTNGGGTGPNTRMKIVCGKISFYYAGKTASNVTYYSGWNTTIPVSTDILAVSFKPTASQNLQPRLFELYLELEYNDKPVVTITAPTGAVTAARPKVVSTWTDSENDTPDRYRIWVYTSAVYSAAGFNPGYTTGWWWAALDQIVPGGVVPDITIGRNLANSTTYKAYMQVRQTDGTWSDIAVSAAFNTVYDEPEQPVVTVAAGGWNNQKVVATVKSGVNLLTLAEYSDPSGSVSTNVGTVTRSSSSTQASIGTTSCKVLLGANNDGGLEFTRLVPVVAGAKYKWISQVYPTAAQTTRTSTVRVKWYQSDGTTLISTYTFAGTSCVAGGWRTVTDTNITAPALAAYAKIAVYTISATNGESYYWDNLQFAPNSDTVNAGSMGDLATEDIYAHLYRSTDGTNWELCADPVITPTANQVIAITDPAPPLGVLLYYSAIVTPTETATGIEWPTPLSASVTITVTPLSTADWIVRDAQDATVDGVVPDISNPNPWEWKSDEQMAKFAGLGRRYPLIVADNTTRARTVDGLTFEFTSKTEYDKFWAMREAQHVWALFRKQTGEQWYMRTLGEVVVYETNTSPIIYRVRMNVAEVPNPALDND